MPLSGEIPWADNPAWLLAITPSDNFKDNESTEALRGGSLPPRIEALTKGICIARQTGTAAIALIQPMAWTISGDHSFMIRQRLNAGVISNCQERLQTSSLTLVFSMTLL